ncbi:unnamed protein product [Parascedosporium putredinis]|uniref:Pectate lyase domain-containing protein n=1 Tax=Parascedosporium putredinis TaxID=1442378 RepID=A0A9P1H0S5_9PEZI|nr:unnamed protein product [Parascedosporium putredinis]CAI7993082.1 unnamed protein product [Parascedosporium putredinis]
MKFSSIFNFALVGLAAAAPTPTVDEEASGLQKRAASITESCNIGYASTNGGTTGGKGGSTTTVSTFAQFTAAAKVSGKLNIVVKGTISGADTVRITSDKTVVGASGSQLQGVDLKVKADSGDAIGIDASTNVWIDHCDLSSDLNNGKDYYDGLLDIKHGADWITVSNTYLHDHTSLVGHSDSQTDDKGKLHVTYANCYWKNTSSRNALVRFGTVHMYNNFFSGILLSGINTRMGAQVRVESSTWEDSKKPIISEDSKEVGYITISDVNYGGGANAAPLGDFSSSKIPYSFTLYGKNNVKSKIPAEAGQLLSF